MSEAWQQQWVGHTVNGQFPLQQFLGSSEYSAVFLTERREDGAPSRAAIKLIPSSPENDEQQLAHWRLAAELSHPNLLRVYEMGRSEIGDVAVLYVVMEYAEESLAEALPAGALAPDEARAVLEVAIEIFRYLHGQGLLHGHFKPSNILAIGNQVKLSCDAVRRVGEPCDGPGRPDAYDSPETVRGAIPVAEGMSPAADVWSLGMTLAETLTQHLPDVQTAGQGEPQFPKALPEPFLDIARHCLLRNPRSRWTVAEIAARLRNPSAPLEPRIPPRAAPPARKLQAPQNLRQKGRNYTVPIAIGLVLVAALTIPRFFRHHPETPPIADAATTQTADQSTQAQRVPALQSGRTIPSGTSATARKQQSTGGVTVPASATKEPPNQVARVPAGTVVPGEVAQQILPDVSESARGTIRGTVRITVKVEVDSSGNVVGADIEPPAGSKYFGSAALDAARNWKFKPAKVAGRNVMSRWSLLFNFTRGDTTVEPTPELP